MSAQSALYTYLITLPAVTSLVSTRIYPSQAPEGVAAPYVVHSTVSERRMPNVQGSSGMLRSRIQVDVYGATLDSVQSVADVLRLNLDGWTQATLGGEYVLSVRLDNVRTDLTGPSDGSDPGTHRSMMEFIFLVGESLPTV